MSIIGLEIRLNLLLRENCFKKKYVSKKKKWGCSRMFVPQHKKNCEKYTCLFCKIPLLYIKSQYLGKC